MPVAPAFDPATGASGGAASAAAYSPLVAGAAPAVQSVAAGGAPAGTTFNAPTGGSGSYSYAAVLQKPSGSSATLSGSGLGAWTISGYANAESYSIVHTATDTVTSETVSQTALVVIAAAVPAPAFTVRESVDFTTDTAVGSRSTGGTSTIYRADGTTPKSVVTVYTNSATGTWGPSWGTADGIIMLGPTSGGAGVCPALDMTAAPPTSSIWLVTLRVKIIEADPSASAIVAYGTAANAASNTNAGMRVDYGATTNTTGTVRWQGGGGVNGSAQNTKDPAVYPYILAQIQMSRGQIPTVVWRQDATEQALPTGLAVRDGVDWFGEHPGAGSISAATTSSPVMAATSAFAILNTSVGATQRIALQKIDTASLSLP